MRIRLLLLFLFLSIGIAKSQDIDSLVSIQQLREGDLLFEVSPKGNAITDVTQGFCGMSIDHVAIFTNLSVIEATEKKGVCVTPIDSFLIRNTTDEGRIMLLAGRVTDDFDTNKTLQHARKFVGMPYDSLFLPDNKAIYCSELIQKSFVDRRGQLIFLPIPMSFHDKSGQITEYWKSFYARFNMNVPEGEPGTNPGEMSRRQNVKIVFRFF